ncbi:MAG: cyclopropane-fatty-acyl-phospholipid synthase family protein [Myxococcota bacterium]|nr:cyclopropane-fatty-acyl-phospholipid synthase family protein [Myxococcota bacterium]
MRFGVELAETGRLPDKVLAAAIRSICRRKLAEIAEGGSAGSTARSNAFVLQMNASPIALSTDAANDQHYEVPPAFFQAVLGPHLKYSCCLFDGPDDSLGEAEARMLALTAERAGIADGMRILDLGCGWGSLSLYLAFHFPGARILAVSNSKDQREFILARAAERGLSNLEVRTADMNTFDPAEAGATEPFDRVVSIEMFEHMRNWGRLFERISGWLAPDGRFFQHVFCHRNEVYPFESRGEADWMARNFFTGGIMPSLDLPKRFDRHLEVEQQWTVDGNHYARTSAAWLRNLDEAGPLALETLGGPDDPMAARRLHRWRMFFVAVREFFALEGGREWFVAHTLMRKRS